MDSSRIWRAATQTRSGNSPGNDSRTLFIEETPAKPASTFSDREVEQAMAKAGAMVNLNHSEEMRSRSRTVAVIPREAQRICAVLR